LVSFVPINDTRMNLCDLCYVCLVCMAQLNIHSPACLTHSHHLKLNHSLLCTIRMFSRVHHHNTRIILIRRLRQLLVMWSTFPQFRQLTVLPCRLSICSEIFLCSRNCWQHATCQHAVSSLTSSINNIVHSSIQ